MDVLAAITMMTVLATGNEGSSSDRGVAPSGSDEPTVTDGGAHEVIMAVSNGGSGTKHTGNCRPVTKILPEHK